jgi:23S rRNA pseudouridine2457 synthase
MILAFHKPWGVLCQFTPDLPGQRTLADFGFPKDIYPIGRLDMDSEGLILLGDEPGFNHRLLDPAMKHPRSYHVQVEGIPDAEALRKLSSGGLLIQGHRTRPCRASLLDPVPDHPPRDPPVRERKSIPTSWLEMTLTEGKNRQVRRMTAMVGHPTLRLIRVAIGGYSAPDLESGGWRVLDGEDLRQVWRTGHGHA